MRDPASVAKSWSQNLARSTEKIREGIQRVQEAPTAAAARRQDAYIEGVRKAAEEGKWRRGLMRVSLSDWQHAVETKAIPRIANGAAAGQSKMEQFMTEWLPHVEQLRSKLAAMPKGTLEDAKQRVIAAIEHNASFRRRR